MKIRTETEQEFNYVQATLISSGWTYNSRPAWISYGSIPGVCSITASPKQFSFSMEPPTDLLIVPLSEEWDEFCRDYKVANRRSEPIELPAEIENLIINFPGAITTRGHIRRFTGQALPADLFKEGNAKEILEACENAEGLPQKPFPVIVKARLRKRVTLVTQVMEECEKTVKMYESCWSDRVKDETRERGVTPADQAGDIIDKRISTLEVQSILEIK